VAAVEAHAVDVDIVDNSFVIDVGDMHRSDIDYGAIVEEVTAPPVAAFVAPAAVAVAVINSTIKSDGRAPIAGMPKIHTFPEGPISGSPQIIRLRRLDPGARHPVVILDVVAPSPIARSPQIPIAGNRRLVIHWQFRRCNTHRNTNSLRHGEQGREAQNKRGYDGANPGLRKH
jgi:hypothetical protein